MHFLFLYTRLPDYFYKCIKYLVYEYMPDAKATVVTYPADKNAPYTFEKLDKIDIIKKEDFSLEKMYQIAPVLIYKAGWADKEYNELSKRCSKVPVIVGLDNFWEGTWRQKIARALSSFLIKRHATHIWCAGKPQVEYAQKLGFKKKQIIEHLYCADTTVYQQNQPKPFLRIIFVGRLVAFKRPGWLLKAFKEVTSESSELSEWTLHIVGNGPLKDSLQKEYQHRQISFSAFTSSGELAKMYADSSIFCLPSINEHWGVVVHEAAAAGLSLLLSDTCGAASMFLDDQRNGLLFQSLSYDDFRQKLKTIMSLNKNQLHEWQMHSKETAKRISHRLWCESLLKTIYEK